MFFTSVGPTAFVIAGLESNFIYSLADLAGELSFRCIKGSGASQASIYDLFSTGLLVRYLQFLWHTFVALNVSLGAFVSSIGLFISLMG
jgi:hypothetical protein